MGLVLMLAMAVQSFDAFHHLEKQLTEKKCLHQASGNKAEVTHAHHDQEHCFVCGFALSNTTQLPVFSFSLFKITPVVLDAFSDSQEIVQFFKGSLFALRAPPVFIV